jgi:hypothetical protein
MNMGLVAAYSLGLCLLQRSISWYNIQAQHSKVNIFKLMQAFCKMYSAHKFPTIQSMFKGDRNYELWIF